MTWIKKDRRTGDYYFGFWLAGRKFKCSLMTRVWEKAENSRVFFEQTLHAIDRGWIQVPNGVNPGEFVLSGGRQQKGFTAPPHIDLTTLFDAFFESQPAGSLEESTIERMNDHRRRLENHFGKSFEVNDLTLTDLQEYIDKSSNDQGLEGREVAPATIEKTLATFQTVWNWGFENNLSDEFFPSKGLRFPKATEKSAIDPVIGDQSSAEHPVDLKPDF